MLEIQYTDKEIIDGTINALGMAINLIDQYEFNQKQKCGHSSVSRNNIEHVYQQAIKHMKKKV